MRALNRLSCLDYLDSRVWAVVDENQGGDDVDNEPEHGDEIRREPEWHLADQPVPPGLQKPVQKTTARAAVLVLAKPFQLTGR